MSADHIAARVQKIGTAILRYGLVAILLMIGATKWTPAEAEAIRPWVADSPFLSWIYRVTSVQGGSVLIGTIEIITTSNQSPDAQGFLMKDFFLLGAAVWSAGEALQASARKTTR
jgi:uncharacterized membrane protein YkgB